MSESSTSPPRVVRPCASSRSLHTPSRLANLSAVLQKMKPCSADRRSSRYRRTRLNFCASLSPSKMLGKGPPITINVEWWNCWEVLMNFSTTVGNDLPRCTSALPRRQTITSRVPILSSPSLISAVISCSHVFMSYHIDWKSVIVPQCKASSASITLVGSTANMKVF